MFLEYVGDPAVNNLRIYAHCVDTSPRPATPVVITHTWTEAGAERTKTARITTDKGAYEIVAQRDPEDVSIEISVPSAGRR